MSLGHFQTGYYQECKNDQIQTEFSQRERKRPIKGVNQNSPLSNSGLNQNYPH